MEINSENQKKLTRWILLLATVCILIYLGVKNIGTVAGAVKWGINLLTPLTMGMFFALILDVPVKFFESHIGKRIKKEKAKKIVRPMSMILAIFLIVGIFAGVIGLVIPEMVTAVTIIAEGVMDVINSVSNAEMPAILEKIPYGETLYHNIITAIDFNEVGTTVANWLKNQSGNIMNTAVGTVSSVVTAVFNFVVAIIFALYVLANKDKLKKQAVRLVKAWIPGKFSSWLLHAVSVGLSIFRSFVSGQTLEAVILGVLCMIGMWILKIPYVATIGALICVTAFIPVVGAVAGTAIGAFMILTEDPAKALIFVIYLLILQQIEGNIIYPKVMGGKVNLPAMWVLAAVTIGGGIAGPLGMLLGVPVTSTIYVLVREETEKREKRLAAKKSAAKKEEEIPCEEEVSE